MPNSTLISIIKKRLQAEQDKQKIIESDKLKFINEIVIDFNSHIINKIVNNDFEIYKSDNSYYIYLEYHISLDIFDPYLNQSDCNYIKSRFETKILELLGIKNTDHIKINYDICNNEVGLISRYINFNFNINISDFIDED